MLAVNYFAYVCILTMIFDLKGMQGSLNSIETIFLNSNSNLRFIWYTMYHV